MAKTAIVTEGSRVRGRAIALRLAEDGFAVVLSSPVTVQAAEKAAAEIRERGGQAMAFHADVCSPEEVEKLFESTLKEFGRIDVVVNNLGLRGLSPIARQDAERFDEMLRVNLRGAFLVLSQAAAHTAPGGRIIAFSNSALSRNLPWCGPYNASIAGVECLVRVLAKELMRSEITVNAIAPERGEEELCLTDRSEEERALLGRMAAVESREELVELVRLVSFLAGPEGGWVNGQVIPVSGGRNAIESSSGRLPTAA